jgi:tRNA A-37 threonylcarbamoyl transferase component Bud32
MTTRVPSPEVSPKPEPKPQPQPNGGAKSRQLAGYEIGERIGHGSEGAVFKARQASSDRTVALRVLSERVTREGPFAERFLEAGNAACGLAHPRLVETLNAAEAGGYFFIVSEYEPSRTLESVLEQHGRLPERYALEITRDLADVLAFVHHETGLVHGSVTPANVFIIADGTPRLADLGVVHPEFVITPDFHKREVSFRRLHYMAPEQVEEDKTPDRRADMYMLGATLHHMLTGERPFRAETAAELAEQILEKPGPSPRRQNAMVSADTSAIVERALQKAPDLRFQTMVEMGQAISLALGTKPEAVKRPNVAQAGKRVPAPREARRQKPVPAGLLVAAAAVLLVILGLGGYFGHRWLKAIHEPVGDPGSGRPRAREEADLEKGLAWLDEHPQAFDRAIARFELLERRILAPDLLAKVKETLSRLRREQAEGARAEFARRQTRSKELAAAGDYDAALAELRRMPPRWGQWSVQRAAKAAHDLELLAVVAVHDRIDKAQALLRDGRSEEAAELIRPVRFSPLDAELAPLRRRLGLATTTPATATTIPAAPTPPTP